MAKRETNTKKSPKPEMKGDSAEIPTCGLVMPVSAIDDCSERHWRDVKTILDDAVREADFEPSLVSEADDVGIIHKRIIQNLYNNPIVVCDVSCKNPNVMFELGIRLAFDKPTIIVKDDKTSYSFDTGSIEHLVYPRGLRYADIVDFKESLAEKIRATHVKATTDPNYTTFLKHFGPLTVVQLDSRTVSSDEYILEELKDLKSMVRRSVARQQKDDRPSRGYSTQESERFIAEVQAIVEAATENLVGGDIADGLEMLIDARRRLHSIRQSHDLTPRQQAKIHGLLKLILGNERRVRDSEGGG